MTKVVYVNGTYRRYSDALVHAEDRGFQFGDAVYEVCEVRDRAIVDEARHMARLERSLGELSITLPMSTRAWQTVMQEVVRRNRVRDGIVYLQVSRGAGPRDFLFGGVETPPTVVCLARPHSRAGQEAAAAKGIAIKSMPDMRWGRCDIKTVMLLPASLAKEDAKQSGAQEAWFIGSDGNVREGGSSNAWIITKNDELVTPKATNEILRGITRTTLIDLIERDGLKLVERGFTIEEAQDAREAFITSATNLVMPVVEIDGRPVGNGHPGSTSLRLRETFHEVAQKRQLAASAAA
ncbi:MAG: D-amino-acid transaminase [Hyphomicrobiaceae bacterium]